MPDRVVQSTEDIQRSLLLKEIACIVSDAKANGKYLKTNEHAVILFGSYPGANFSVGRIVDELIVAASARGVPIEISRPHPESS